MLVPFCNQCNAWTVVWSVKWKYWVSFRFGLPNRNSVAFVQQWLNLTNLNIQNSKTQLNITGVVRRAIRAGYEGRVHYASGRQIPDGPEGFALSPKPYNNWLCIATLRYYWISSTVSAVAAVIMETFRKNTAGSAHNHYPYTPDHPLTSWDYYYLFLLCLLAVSELKVFQLCDSVLASSRTFHKRFLEKPNSL